MALPDSSPSNSTIFKQNCMPSEVMLIQFPIILIIENRSCENILPKKYCLIIYFSTR